EGTPPRFVAAHEVYDPQRNLWLERAPLTSPRSDLAAAVVRGRLYVFGGQAPDGPVVTVEAYDPGADRWVALGTLPAPRREMVAVTAGDVVHLLGGFWGHAPTDKHEVYRTPSREE